MIALVRIALSRPYTFVVLALLLLIIGPLAALRTPTDEARRPLHRAADAIGRRLGRQVASGEPVYLEDLA